MVWPSIVRRPLIACGQMTRGRPCTECQRRDVKLYVDTASIVDVVSVAGCLKVPFTHSEWVNASGSAQNRTTSSEDRIHLCKCAKAGVVAKLLEPHQQHGRPAQACDRIRHLAEIGPPVLIGRRNAINPGPLRAL